MSGSPKPRGRPDPLLPGGDQGPGLRGRVQGSAGLGSAPLPTGTRGPSSASPLMAQRGRRTRASAAGRLAPAFLPLPSRWPVRGRRRSRATKPANHVAAASQWAARRVAWCRPDARQRGRTSAVTWPPGAGRVTKEPAPRPGELSSAGPCVRDAPQDPRARSPAQSAAARQGRLRRRGRESAGRESHAERRASARGRRCDR